MHSGEGPGSTAVSMVTGTALDSVVEEHHTAALERRQGSVVCRGGRSPRSLQTGGPPTGDKLRHGAQRARGGRAQPGEVTAGALVP